MIILSTLIDTFFTIISGLLTAYSFVVIARSILSWVNPDPYNPIVRFLYIVTEPVLWRIRKFLPFTYMNGLDFSPIVLLIGVFFAQRMCGAIAVWLLSMFSAGGTITY